MHKHTRTETANNNRHNIEQAIELLDPFVLSVCLGIYPCPYLTVLLGVLWAKGLDGRHTTRRDSYAAAAIVSALSALAANHIYDFRLDAIMAVVGSSGLLYLGATRLYLWLSS